MLTLIPLPQPLEVAAVDWVLQQMNLERASGSPRLFVRPAAAPAVTA